MPSPENCFGVRTDWRFDRFPTEKVKDDRFRGGMRVYAVSMIGAPAVGKTTIASAILKVKSTTDYKPTVGASMVKIPYAQGADTSWFYLWDTAGMERYRALAPVYYRDSKGALVVYDVADRRSFAYLSDWVKLYRDSCGFSNPIMVIGNKIDLERTVTEEEGEAYAKSIGAAYLEISAMDGTNIDAVIPRLYDLLGKVTGQVTVTEEIPAERRQCCN
jgi:small GTP-binding protein